MASPQTSLTARRVSCALFLVLSLALIHRPASAQTLTYERTTTSSTTAGQTHTAVRLRDGRVFIATASAYHVYDPLTNTTAASAFTNALLPGVAAVAAHDGSVLLTGGRSGIGVTQIFRVAISGTTMSLSLGPRMNVGRFNHAMVGLADGTVVVLGGETSTNAPTTSIERGSWTESFNYQGWQFANSGALATARTNFTATVDRYGRIIVVGGRGAGGAVLNSIELIDPTTGVSTPGPTLATGRYSHSVAALPDGRLLVTGGKDGSGAATASVEILTPRPAGVTVAAATTPMSVARASHSATVLPDGRVLIAGGGTASAEYYTTTATSPAPALSVARTGHAAIPLADGSVFIANGDTVAQPNDIYRPDGQRPGFALLWPSASVRQTEIPIVPMGDGRLFAVSVSNTFDLYDPATDTSATASFVANGQQPSPFNVLSPSQAVMVPLTGDSVLYLGNSGSTAQSAVITVSGSSYSWQTTGARLTGRLRPTAARLADGSVLITGGYLNTPLTYLTSAEHFNPTTRNFSTVAASGVGGYGSSISVMNDGRAFVIGGLQGETASNAVLEFNPVTKTFTRVATLRMGRYWHTATPIDSRRIAIVGGIGEEGQAGFTGAVEVVDVVTGTSVLLASGLMQPRAFHAAELQPNGTILVVGGSTGVAALSSIEQFDLGPAASQLLFPTALARIRPLLARTSTGGLIVAGTDGVNLNVAEGFTVHTDTQAIARLQAQTVALAAAAQNASDSLTRYQSWFNELRAGDNTRQHLVTAAPLAAERPNVSGVTLLDGRVLLAGGGSATNTTRSVEVFDPATGAWTVRSGALSTPRNLPATAVLDDGRVLVSGSSTTFDLIDPTTLTTTAAAGAGVSRLTAHAAGKLADGRVLLAGGTTASFLLDLFDPRLKRAVPAGATLMQRHGRPEILPAGDDAIILGGSTATTMVERWSDRSGEIKGTLAIAVAGTRTSWDVAGLPPNTIIPKGALLVSPGNTTPLSAAANVTSEGLATLVTASATHGSLPAGTPVSLVRDTAGSVVGSVSFGQTTIPSLIGFSGNFALAAGDRLAAQGQAGSPLTLIVAASAVADGDGTFTNLSIEPAPAFVSNGYAQLVWTVPAGDLMLPRSAPAATLLDDGRVFLSGGTGNILVNATATATANANLQSAEIYDPATGTSGLTIGRPTYSLTNPVATKLLTGEVVVTGQDVDLFDPATQSNELAAVSPTMGNRGVHAAALLPDGRVLIAGGATTTVEIFTADGVSYNDLTTRVGVLEQSVAQLTTARDGLALQVAALTAQVTTVQGQLTTASATIVTLQSQLTTTQQQLTTAATQIANLQGQLALANTANTTLQQSNVNLEGQVNSLQTQLSQQATVIAGLQTQVTDAANGIALRDQAIAARDLTIATQNTTITTQGAAITSLTADKAGLTQQVGDLNGLLSSAAADNLSLTSQVSTLTGANSSLTSLLADANQTIAARDTTIVQLTTDKNALTASVNALTADKAALETQVGSLTTQLADATLAIARRDTTITQQTATIGSLTGEKNALMASVSTLTAEKSALESQVGSLTTELATANLAIAARDTTIAQLSIDQAALESAVTALTADKAALQSQVGSLTTQLADAHQTIINREMTIAQLVTDLATANQTIAARDATITQQAATIASLTDDRNVLATQLAAANAENGVVTTQLSVATQTISQQQDTIAGLSADKASLQASLDTAGLTIAGLNTQVTTLTADKTALTTQLATVQSQLTTSQASLAAANQTVAARDATIAQQQSTIATLTSNKTALQTQLNAATASVATLTTQIATVTSQRNALQTQVATLTTEKGALQAQITALTSQKTALQGQVTSLQAQVVQLQQQQQQMVVIKQFLARVEDALTIMRRIGFVIPGSTPEAQLENLVDAINDMPRSARLQLLKELIDERGSWRWRTNDRRDRN